MPSAMGAVDAGTTARFTERLQWRDPYLRRPPRRVVSGLRTWWEKSESRHRWDGKWAPGTIYLGTARGGQHPKVCSASRTAASSPARCRASSAPSAASGQESQAAVDLRHQRQ